MVEATKICRACLLQNFEMLHLFSEVLLDKPSLIKDILMEITTIQIAEADGFPDMICLGCVEEIKRAFAFKKMVENSDSVLRSGSVPQKAQGPIKIEPGIDLTIVKPEPETEIHFVNVDVNPETNLSMEIEEAILNIKSEHEIQSSTESLGEDVADKIDISEIQDMNMEEPQEIIEADVAINSLPPKSKKLYDEAYNGFMQWCKSKKAKIYTEKVLLAYFTEKVKECKSSELWTQYSMLKACLIANDNVNIAQYPKLIAFLRKNSDGHSAKKSKMLMKQQIGKFLSEANDDEYFTIKMEQQSVPVLEAQKAAKAIERLSKTSKEVYDKEYDKFLGWMVDNSEEIVNESLLLRYFDDLSETFSPSSLWAKYSMLKKMLLVNKNFDIAKYYKLGQYLKQGFKGYEAKKSKVLTREEIVKFVRDAPNKTYLMMKVAMCFILLGGCRRAEMVNMLDDHVEDRGSVIVVTVAETNTEKRRVFTIIEETEMGCLKLIREYTSLRQEGCSQKRFFLNYREGRCTAQPVGKNTFGKIPGAIATYLGLKDAKKYTRFHKC